MSRRAEVVKSSYSISLTSIVQRNSIQQPSTELKLEFVFCSKLQCTDYS